ncbi:MAG: trigger factor [Lachnospiraceae bacterium]|nr:trigger factor [Lachnospiraceae bacterium]
MSIKVEKIDGNMARITIESTVEEFEAALEKAFQKNKNRINVQGFRKGKAPRAMVEKIYGPGIFYEDAANEIIPELYDKAMEDEACKALDIVSRPEIDVIQVEKGKPFVFTAEVALRPEVELGQYKGFSDIEKKVAEVTDEEVDQEVNRIREQNSRTVTVEDRPVQEGDIAVIDYEGFESGAAFEGGKGENHELTIGSHSFIPGFEEQLIGHNAGEEFDIDVTFPEEYHSKELAGKPAVFKVKINSIKFKELPELNDEFAEEVSDFDTLSEYIEDTKKKIAERKQAGLDAEFKQAVLRKAVENAKMDIPQAMIDEQARTLVNDYAQRLQQQGMSLDMYFKYTGQKLEDLQAQFTDEAKTRIENSLVLDAIAKAENVEITEEDFEKEYQNIADMYRMELDKVKEIVGEEGKENMRKDLAAQKAYELIAQ